MWIVLPSLQKFSGCIFFGCYTFHTDKMAAYVMQPQLASCTSCCQENGRCLIDDMSWDMNMITLNDIWTLVNCHVNCPWISLHDNWWSPRQLRVCVFVYILANHHGNGLSSACPWKPPVTIFINLSVSHPPEGVNQTILNLFVKFNECIITSSIENF